MNLRRFYIAPRMVQTPRPEISGSDAGHICRVLRLTAGDVVELFDGTGNGYRARIVAAAPQRVVLSIEASFSLQSESPLNISLAQAVLKDRKMDDLVRQLTELGIARWIPFYAARSVPVPGKRGVEARRIRWEKIALEAVKQCRRGRIPQIAPVSTFGEVLAASIDHDLSVLFWEGASQGFDLAGEGVPKPKSILLVVGPEGGFDLREVEQATAHGFLATGLGPRILRAETAALAACTLVQYCCGDMGYAATAANRKHTPDEDTPLLRSGPIR